MAFLLNGTPVEREHRFGRKSRSEDTTFAYPAMAVKLSRKKAFTGGGGQFQDGGSELELASRLLLNRLHI